MALFAEVADLTSLAVCAVHCHPLVQCPAAPSLSTQSDPMQRCSASPSRPLAACSSPCAIAHHCRTLNACVFSPRTLATSSLLVVSRPEPLCRSSERERSSNGTRRQRNDCNNRCRQRSTAAARQHRPLRLPLGACIRAQTSALDWDSKISTRTSYDDDGNGYEAAASVQRGAGRCSGRQRWTVR